MLLSWTLSTYLVRQFLIGIGIAFLTLATLIFLFDLVELSRRAASESDADFVVVVRMAALHLPYLTQRIVPYSVLMGVMLTLTHLMRSQEMAIIRTSGVSTWQMLLPALLLALAIGTFMVVIFNPLAAAMLFRYELLDGKFLRGNISNLAVSSSGLWLRQADDEGEAVIHAQRITQPELTLHEVIIFRYQGKDHFVQRIDAATAKLEDGYWALSDTLITAPDQLGERHATFNFPTELTISQIQDSFSAPETLSFWQIPRFVALLERAGFSALKHRLYWNSVLAGPLLLLGMVLIGATFSLRSVRRGGTGLTIAAGVLTGFVLYVFSDVVTALGLSASIPMLFAAWAPAGVTVLAGTGMLLYVRGT
ncbi:MAG: LPS export ABC transporter permease LptG [Alphaproteobacteria bacterium]|jgi:lipopolysaccharide export system permease protein|nr:LPS export ABC transporter permease LptG [Alphaproteobacteria bacterium]MDP7173965.1 LPS export ABC transporter permease LptG [Alphaproteobacteria bacterium]MDP7233315.1 LPS export ABC transporter permease LptG [Alphaproteobacteria bacterium]MDP7487554.1 LPS export ABC transporter permease LptG [Alphaproteobacteria bacterium]HJN21475.1 LPS export ABC transporter permease LptG [Alphaproteobacteria bacterium]|tara:strand:+ start:797 stop:1891 length:1095 start_codon:yes stop_codon:yes gene_type:complete